MRIAFLLAHSGPESAAPRLSGVTEEIVSRLAARNARVDLLAIGQEPLEISALLGKTEHDVYVLKAKTPLTLALAAAAASHGTRVVNSVESSILTRDKLASTAVLAAFGVPVPPSFATAETELLGPLLNDGAVWIKPQRGSQGAGVQRLTRPDQLARAHDLARDAYGLPQPVFAQREVPSGGRDLKVYVVGEQMWAITRPFPALTLAEKLGSPVPVPPGIREAAVVCGQALGLELYGVDFVVAGDAFFVVDVNALPGYKGVSEAPRAIAEHIYQAGVAA
jgi:ribosomal protein S6--L-glutamate ligase